MSLTRKAEISFMVYRQNGVGGIERRTLEMNSTDFISCTSSNREKNSQLKSWAMNQFPGAKDVKIQGIKWI